MKKTAEKSKIESCKKQNFSYYYLDRLFIKKIEKGEKRGSNNIKFRICLNTNMATNFLGLFFNYFCCYISDSTFEKVANKYREMGYVVKKSPPLFSNCYMINVSWRE